MVGASQKRCVPACRRVVASKRAPAAADVERISGAARAMAFFECAAENAAQSRHSLDMRDITVLLRQAAGDDRPELD
jgi:hypothetical protein